MCYIVGASNFKLFGNIEKDNIEEEGMKLESPDLVNDNLQVDSHDI